MKKYIIFAVLVLCLPIFFLIRQKEKPKSSSPVLRIGAECDYVPNSWEENKASQFNIPVANHQGYYADGYDIQIARLVAGRLGYELEVMKFAWNDLLPSLNNGDIDAIFSSMLDTDERKKIAAFSEPYELNKAEYAILVDSVSQYITAKTLSDFSGAKIIGESGTKLDDVIEQIPGVIHFRPEDTVQGMIDRVLNGDADGAVIDTDTGHYYEMINKNLTLVKFTEGGGFQLGFTGVCAGVRKNDIELLNRINMALEGISRSERQNIMDKVKSRMMNVR